MALLPRLPRSWPNGPTGHGKENLWEIAVDGSAPRKIAGYGLFDDPLYWKPDQAGDLDKPGSR